MDNNSWRAAQGQIAQGQGSAGEASAMPNATNTVAAAAIDNVDWRSQLPADSRHRIVNKIMDTLKRHLPFSGQEGLQELKKIAVRFEEKIYTAAMSQSDYLRKISLKMLTMETKSQNPIANSNAKNPSDQVSMVNNQSQARQQLLAQNMQSTLTSAGGQNSGSLTSNLPSVGNLTQSNMPNVVGQNNLQNIPNISSVTQNPVGNSMGQGIPSNVFANSQRQMPGRQQVAAQQQQQQSTSSQLLYHQQLQQQYMKQKLQQGSIQQSLMQSHIQQQQQQQQNLLQPTQIQNSQQAVMQPSVMQSTSLSNLQQNHQSSVQQGTQSVHQQHSQSVMRQPQQPQQSQQQQQQQQQQQPQQAPILHQQQTSMSQQQILSAPQQQQQQQLIGQQQNTANISQSQLIGQSNSIPDLQQQQRLMGQQNNISNLQQQQLMGQQNNLSNMHQSQLGPQSSVSGLQQSQMMGTQSGNSGMPANQHSVHMLQQKMQHNLIPNQVQQSQTQPMQQQMMSQMQSQNGQLQHLQQQSNPMQRDIQQRLQNSGALIQQQNVIEQQKQLFQSQRAIPEGSSTSLDSTAQTGNGSGGDWQEEVYQKIKAMKEMYFTELNEMYSKIVAKMQQHESLSQHGKNDQFDKLKLFRVMLERIVQFLRLNKNDILIGHKDKLSSVEKQIVNILNSHRPRKPVSLQQGQHPQPHMQQPQAQSQISQMQPHENQMNPQMQSMNVPSSVATMQQNNLSGLQHTSLSSVPTVSNSQQSMINGMQPASNPDGGQSNALNSLQQVAMSSLQQNPVSGSQSVNISSLTSQSGMNTLQPNLNNLQSNSTMLQNQHLKQQEQQMLQSQQLKQQMQQRQIQHQFMHRQQLMQQQQQQQTKQQQQPAQLPGHHMSPLHQMTDSSDIKMRQQMGVKPGVFQQHHSTAQRATFHHQQLKPGPPFSMTSPQVLQAASPQVSQHHSPQIDQQNLLSSITKTGTPLQSANSPFVMPSPSTPLAPSPMPGESEKVNSGISSLSNMGNIGHHQTTAISGPAQSLAIGTPGISASPLLAEFTGPDAAHGNASSVISSKLNAVEQPFERLIKAVKSVSREALTASVSDISSVVSMVDRIAGSAPGNGSRAAVGEDLVAMTKCRLQARNFFTQDGPSGTKRMRRSTSAMPSNVVPSSGSINESGRLLNGSDVSEMESTATSSIKRPRAETNHALLEEIHEINRRLIDSVVDVCEEDVDPTAVATAAEGGEGTIVKCTFSAVALSPNLKSQYASAQMSPIQPLRLLIPTNYPNCSPILLDKFPIEVSKEYEDLSIKAKSRFNVSLRSLSQPMSLEEMAKTWDMCARAVISEYAQQSGGGTFSSRYGTWENCLSAA